MQSGNECIEEAESTKTETWQNHFNQSFKESFATNLSCWFENTVNKPSPSLRIQFNKLNENVSVDVVIVGGGIVGVSTVYTLSRSGKSVAVIENDYLESGETGYTIHSIQFFNCALMKFFVPDILIKWISDVIYQNVYLVVIRWYLLHKFLYACVICYINFRRKCFTIYLCRSFCSPFITAKAYNNDCTIIFCKFFRYRKANSLARASNYSYFIFQWQSISFLSCDFYRS